MDEVQKPSSHREMAPRGFPEDKMGSCWEIEGRRAWSFTSPWVPTIWWSADSTGAWAHRAYRGALDHGQAICRALADRSIRLKQSGDDVKIERQSKIEKKLPNTAINKASSCCNKACQIILPLLQDSYFLFKTAGFQKIVFLKFTELT